MKILHIDSSILGSGSVTRELSTAIVAAIRADYPAVQVDRLDLVEKEIRHLNGPIAAGFRSSGADDVDDATLKEHKISEDLLTQFMASDVLVIGVPMYNFSIPSQLKAWLDRLAQVGRTFKYTENGPVGLVVGKRVIIASGRGGFYAASPLAHMDFQESYLEAFFKFLGITDIHIIRAEGASNRLRKKSS